MHRPPHNHLPQGGGVPGGCGGAYPQSSSFPQNLNINPQLYPLQLQQQQQQALPPQFFFQTPNPSFPNPFILPQFQNPSFLNPCIQAPAASLPTQNFVLSPQSQSPSFQGPKVSLERIESAVLKVQTDLVTAAENVSAWKVSQAALLALQVDSWGSLGFQLQDVPSLKRLLVTEGKVNAFIHCFVAAQRITSLYDLEVAICKNEGIEHFEELGLGPLSCHPLAQHYFSISSDTVEIFKLSSEEIIVLLHRFLDKHNRKIISVEEFLDFLVEQKSLTSKGRLGVRIQSLGLHISCIRKAKRAERTILAKSLDKFKKGTEERIFKDQALPLMHVEKKMLDKRFDSISGRIKSFSSLCNDVGGKHTRFDNSPIDEYDDSDDDNCVKHVDTGLHKSSCHDSGSSQSSSKCPYPSTSEEMRRLGLKIDIGEKVNHIKDQQVGIGGYFGKKRKRKREENNDNIMKKFLRKEEVFNVDMAMDTNSLLGHSFEKFITTWKEACLEHSASEVLDQMLNFYMPSITKNKKGRIKKIFSSYPGAGLLYIAVTSIRRGLLNSVYDTVQAFGDFGSTPCAGIIEIGSSVKDPQSNVDEENDVHGCRATVDDIVQSIAKFFGLGIVMPCDREISFGKQFETLKKLSDCEKWLITQFSVKDFSLLGHGSFFSFLEQHASLLPSDMCTLFNESLPEQSCVQVGMLQQQLGLLLSQAQSNLIDKDDVSKSDCSLVLSRQFPTINFCLVGNEQEKCFSDLIKRQKENLDSTCVLYSVSLLGKRLTGDVLAYREALASEASYAKPESGRRPHTHGNFSCKDALECLLKVPMLSDLLTWSHWDVIYAPALGPLSDWLLNEVNAKELLCVATVDGKFIRIDHSATVDDFLEAMIQCSPFQVALKLLSLLSLYGGVGSAPLSLLKCYVQQAIDVIIRNYTDSVEVSNTRASLSHKNASCGQSIVHNVLNVDIHSIEMPQSSQVICEESSLSESIFGINRAVTDVARFILQCLDYLPSEFRCFGLEILVSGFKCVAKDAYSVILGQCGQTCQRIMLHNIGLSLGIAEWVNDFHEFNLTAGADLFMASMTSDKNFLHTRSGRTVNHTEDATDKIISGEHHMPTTTNENPELPDRGSGSTMPNGCSNGKYTDDADGGDLMKNNIIQDANCVVESIRREEFGLDPNLEYTESCMLKKQHARLGRALHCLSQELYSQDSHLLLELVQNADDNIYPEDVDPTLVFILQDSGIIVLNNELGFSAQNIRALCDIGNSTKKGSGAGYIGHKGIGFKSVFRITDAPEIHSNGFHVKFDISEGQIGFILPTVIQPCNVNMSKLLLPGENLSSDGNQWNTCIVLPFRSKSREGTGLSSIMSMFSDLHPSLLLFLHRLRCIKFKNMLNNSLVDMRREILGNGIVRVSHGQVTMTWLVISKKLPATLIRPDVQGTEIAVAFTLEECENGEYKPHLSQQPVFAFLPLRSYGLKFILQGDFVLPSSREEVDGDSAWNQWLLSEFPALFVSAEQSFCALPCFQKCPGKAVTIYMGFVPVGGEVYGFFSRLPRLIISKLRTSHCLLLDGPDLTWVLPCRVLRGWNEQGRMLLSDSLLQKHLGLGYLNKDIELPDALANALGVQEYGPKVLVEFISSVCRSSDGIQSLGLDWLSLWLSVLHSTLPTHSSGHFSVDSRLEYELVDSLKKIPFIPLSDGSYSSVANGTIWLPCDLSSGIEGKCSAKDFPNLFAKLRTVSPFLLSVAAKGAYEVGEARRESPLHMLYKIGVQQLSAHEIIKSHILVALSKDIYTDEDRYLMVEYLSFIFVHFQYDCLKCSSEKVDILSEVRKRAVLLTNHGYKCPIDEPVHFGKEYKNPVSVDKLIIDVDGQWPEVDVAYLKHHSTRSMPSGLSKWRDFFQELGVTDFVGVTCIKKSAFDLPLDITPNEGSNIAAPVINDWASPELLNFLSTFSSKKCREKCIYLLEVLDRMWDDSYNAYSRSCIIFKSNKGKKTMESSFLKSLREIEWIASSMDQDLHQSKDLFYDCDEVRSILGNSAPYAVPQVTSKLLLKDIGFKVEVSLSDALEILHLWRMSKAPFMASILQMSKFYSFIFDGLSKLEVQMKEELISSSFIFIPFFSTSKSNNVVSGLFLSPKELYWHDPTGCADKIREVLRLCSSVKENNCLPCKALATVYPGLSDFFVNVCGVPKSPSFDIYLQILQQLSSISLPSQAASVVFRVFERWADDVKSGSVTPDEVVELKESLYKLESTVIPTLQDRWVSLHASFGLICWPDDDELKQQFKHSDGIDFLHFGELSEEDQKILSGRVAMFLRDLGVPALSEVVSREAISYGTEDNREKAALINWVLPYAQRYLLKFCPDVYLNFKQLQSEKLGQLQVIVVDKLFYRNCLKGRGITSKRRSECSCLLQGTMLYSTQTADSHSIFLELSRLFFNGSTELLFANFLHMIATMAESGSSLEQTEFFIVNSQKVPPLPIEEPVWSFSPLPENPKLETPQPILTPTNIYQNSSTSQKRSGTSPNWPPTGWKTAPDVSYARANYHLTRPWNPSMKESSATVETIPQSEDLLIPAEIDGKLIVGDSTTEASPSFESSNNMDATALRQFQQPPDEVQVQKTGRLGEVIAYNYFVGKLGSGNVKWVNEETETGLPYDLIVTGGEGSGREYIEVKATRSSSKDWFEISPREWQSAVEMGDSYSIAHVLLGAKKASIVVLKNPLRLCQQNALQLALLMSRQLRDQLATAS